MVRKLAGQTSVVEVMMPAAAGSNKRLGRIAAQVGWHAIETLLHRVFAMRGPGAGPVRPWLS